MSQSSPTCIAYNFYAVCVNGSYVEFVKNCLKGTNIRIAGVIGFPLGAMDTDSKVYEAKKCIEYGADEIDMVINVGLLKSGCYVKVLDEVRIIKEAIGDKILKVILKKYVTPLVQR